MTCLFCQEQLEIYVKAYLLFHFGQNQSSVATAAAHSTGSCFDAFCFIFLSPLQDREGREEGRRMEEKVPEGVVLPWQLMLLLLLSEFPLSVSVLSENLDASPPSTSHCSSVLDALDLPNCVMTALAA